MCGKRIGVGLLALGLCAPDVGASQAADILVRGGILLDGTGAPARTADVAVRDGRIVAVGPALDGWRAADTIDAAGLVVAPGFIDLHSHAESGLSDPERASATNLLLQGVTTVVVGQDGAHAWPVGGSLGDRVALWEGHGIGVNVVPLAGMWAARREVLGRSREPATASQRAAIARRIERLLEEGAWGLSSGLAFTPYVRTEEAIDASRPVAAVDGVHVSHVRDEGERLPDAIDELIRVGRASGARVVVSHLKWTDRSNWGNAEEIVGRLRAARESGVDIWADLYPYTVSGGGIDVDPIPDEARPRLEGDLADPARRQALLEAVGRRIAGLGGPARLVVLDHPDHRDGKATLAEAAHRRGVATARAAVELSLEGARFLRREMSELDVATFIAQPFVAASSDGWISEDGSGPDHPRSYGAFPRRIARYVRELGAIDLPFAVHGATGLAARIIGLPDRGTVEVGARADLVLFDPDRIADRATYANPRRHPTGVEWVLVDGAVAVAHGEPTGRRAGRVILRGGE